MGSALAPVAPKLGKLLPVLASNHDGEVVAAARAIGRTLQAAGLDFHALAGAVTSPAAAPSPQPQPADDYWDGTDPDDWRTMARWCRDFDAGRLTPREHGFVWDLASDRYARREPSDKQRKWLRAIYVKLSRWVD